MRSICTHMVGLAVAAGLMSFAAVPAAADDAALVASLRGGGYVLFLRHFSTDRSRGDTDTAHLENCATQRPLSDAGRQQAEAFGAALRALKIPVGAVTFSQFCRAIDSARLAGFATVSPTVDLAVPDRSPAAESERRAAALRRLLSSAPATGTNSLLVSHQPNLVEAAGKEFSDVEEGEVAVFQPVAGAPGYRAVGRVTAAEWTRWARVAK